MKLYAQYIYNFGRTYNFKYKYNLYKLPIAVQNFASGTDAWAATGSSATVANSSGKLSFTTTNKSSTYMSKSYTVNTGKHYRLSLDLDAGSLTNATLSVMGNGSHVLSTYNFTGITHQQIDFVADGPTITIKVLIGSGSGSRVVYIDNLKLEEIVEGLNKYWFDFYGREKDNETYGTANAYDFGARIYDARLGRWLSVDPFQAKYPSLSPLCFVGNMPLIAIDPDGKDIIFLIDKNAAAKNGHTAVLIGNETAGWVYISMNGTGDGAKPWGVSQNPDLGTRIVDENNKPITNMSEAILRANTINPKESEHNYDGSKRIITTPEEDLLALESASASASEARYGICGPGKSCIDVSQAAFSSVVKNRTGEKNAPGSGDLVPNRWFNKLEERVGQANRKISDVGNKIKFYEQPLKERVKFTPPSYSEDSSNEQLPVTE